jgi:periplasmic divalent cation tolerance protein
MTNFVLLLTTWPDEEGARLVAKDWLNKKLVACVNILPKMQSLYVWNGELKSGSEHQMLLKTSLKRVKELEQRIIEMHPYECPEILQIPVTGGFEAYLNWIKGNTE